MEIHTKFCSKLLTLIAFLIVSFAHSAFSQYGSFSQYVSQDGWSGNVEFNVPFGSEAKPLIIGLHPAQSAANGMRDMLKSSSDRCSAILVCPDGADNTLSESIFPLINYCKSHYNIDESKIILTGYSAGGGTTFNYGTSNYFMFKGLIGIAAYGYNPSQLAIENLGFAMIVGTADNLISFCRDYKTQIENAGGYVKLIEVAGVKHSDPYFISSAFSNDWNECYDFVMAFIPKPGRISLLSPDNGEIDVLIPVQLTWEEDEKADSYEVEVYLDGELADSKSPTTNTVKISGLLPGTEYTWKVRGINSGGEGQWSNEWLFKTKPVKPTAQATLLEPENGAIDQPRTITCKWSVISGADNYKIQLLNNADSVIKEYDYLSDDGETFVEQTFRNLDYETTYKWQVMGKNSAGNGPWSEQWTFTTIPAAPEATVLIEPADASNNVSTFPELKWVKTEKANSYYLQIIEYATEEYAIEDSTIGYVGGDTVTYLVKSELKGLTKYKWRVSGINAGGRGQWSEFRTFTTWDPAGVDDYSNSELKSSLVPNPISNTGYLEFYLNQSGQIKISIRNIIGIEVFNITDYLSAGNQKIPLNISNLADGIYFYKIGSGKSFECRKFVIKR